MATITTTIREPKTFQQIQDQQNELGKNQTLESLNDNISKLIKAITDKDQKRETEQDRQLKMNQLELSKLQLRRAQLGLAKDEKYYSDYSRKWSEKNNFGTSMGLDKNTSGNLGAIGVSALTAGALNPVIVKQLLFPIITPLMNVTKALATFPGLLPGLFRRSSGKSSSAIASDPDRKLHGKLDQILGAIKDKTKSSKAKEEKEQSMLSKFLNALLLGAAGMFMASELLGGADGSIMNTLETYGPIMIAGYALGGWKGALVGFGLQFAAEELGILKKDAEKKTIFDFAAEKAVDEINKIIPGLDLKESEFKLAMVGLAFGGWKGMALGYLLGNEAFRTALIALRDQGLSGLQDSIKDKINEMKKGTILEGIAPEIIEGAIVGGAIGLKGGPKGLLVGALLGAAGGFVWNRIDNQKTPEKYGIETKLDYKKFDWVINGTEKTWNEFRDEVRQKHKDEKHSKEEWDELTASYIQDYIKENNVDNNAGNILGIPVSKETEQKVDKLKDKVLNIIKDYPELTVVAMSLLGTKRGRRSLTNALVYGSSGVINLLKKLAGKAAISTAGTVASNTAVVAAETSAASAASTGAAETAASGIGGTVANAAKAGAYIAVAAASAKNASDAYNSIDISDTTSTSSEQIDENNRKKREEHIEAINSDKLNWLDKFFISLGIGFDTIGSGGSEAVRFGTRIAEKKTGQKTQKEKIIDNIEKTIDILEKAGIVKRSASIDLLTGNTIEIQDQGLLDKIYSKEQQDLLLRYSRFDYKDINDPNLQKRYLSEIETQLKLTNKELSNKIEEQKKQKEEQNQYLIDNNTNLVTVNQTLQDVNKTLKQTPIQWVDGQPQPVIEGYTPIPNGTSPYN